MQISQGQEPLRVQSYTTFQSWCSCANREFTLSWSGRTVMESSSRSLFPYVRPLLWLHLCWKVGQDWTHSEIAHHTGLEKVKTYCNFGQLSALQAWSVRAAHVRKYIGCYSTDTDSAYLGGLSDRHGPNAINRHALKSLRLQWPRTVSILFRP